VLYSGAVETSRLARWLTAPLLVACASAEPPCPAAFTPTLVAASHAAHPAASANVVSLSPFSQTYERDARKIIDAARGKPAAYEKLRQLTDGIGHRLSGSPALDRAIDWAEKTLAADGHENVRKEKVMVPHWERGAESAEILGPTRRPLTILGLGGSEGTPKGGIEGEVLVVRSFEELEKAGAAVKDKIVLFDVAMRGYEEGKGTGYGDVVQFRASGPSKASKLGAKAVLVRSLATSSLNTPHTGATRFDDGVKKIPAAAVTVEDAALIARLSEQGERVRVRLTMGAKTKPDAPSANVLAELVGREKPDEIVLIGGHLDSWDVGQGAHDDGAGCVIMMQALTTLRALGMKPRRTIRVVLFTNEENGIAGARAYAKDHAAEVAKHVLGVEADSGGFAPWGFTVEVPKDRLAKATRFAEDVAALLAPVGALQIKEAGSGADLIPLVKEGMPGMGYVSHGQKYFDYHHSAADTLDKVDPRELADGVAVVAVLAWIAAEMPDRI
jgi:carboxypeptidase Q